jgi:membrane fusion protein, multidrug efflux system
MNNEPIGPERQLPAKTGGRSTAVKVIVWVAILLIFGAGFVLLLNHHEDAAKSAAGSRRGATGPVTINTATASKGDIGVYLNAIGTVTPVYTSSITSQVNGIIEVVHYREGQIVRKGDPLVDIDPRPYQATLMQAEGTLERDQNVLAESRMDLERYKDAWAKNAIPKQTLEDQEKIVLQNAGTVKLDQGVVQYDQVQLDFCHIVSPINGRVGLRLVDPGNVVQSSGATTLAVVTQLQPMTVIFTIAEDSIGQVAPHLLHSGKLEVAAFDRTANTKIADGSLLTIDSQIDTTTGTGKGRATFPNKDNALYPNQFVNTRLLVNTLHGVTLIPTATIQHNGTDSFVYVVQNGAVVRKDVKPGVIDGDTTQVTGINPGDVIANSSFDKLQDNVKIVLTKSKLPATSQGSSAP